MNDLGGGGKLSNVFAGGLAGESCEASSS